MIISAKQYGEILEVLPILCVDIVITNPKGEYLLIKRSNEPLKGQWWVIGGRVFKGESLKQAAIRKTAEEVGLTIADVRPIGYYEDTFEKNIFGSPTPLHSVSVVFSSTVDGDQPVELDEQSLEWKFCARLPHNFKVVPFACEGRGDESIA